MPSVATPRYDLHTTHAVALGCAQEKAQRMKCLLCSQAMQIEFSRAGNLAASEPLPAGSIHTRRLSADTQVCRRRRNRTCQSPAMLRNVGGGPARHLSNVDRSGGETRGDS